MILYKYIKLENLISTIKNGVYAAKPSELNDPFEWSDLSKDQIKQYRICCLTGSYNQKLMWSHYANGHRGCIVSVELPKELETGDSVIRKVNYTSRKEVEKIKKPIERLYQKDKKWSNEKEWRAVYDSKCFDSEIWQEKDDKVFLKAKVKKVWFGCAVDQESVEYLKVIKMIQDFNIQKKKADKIEINSYKIAEGETYRFVINKDNKYG